MKRTTSRSLITVLGLVCAGPLVAQWGDQASPVEVGQARVTTMAPTMQVAGTVISRQDAVLSAEVNGRLLHLVDVGTRVESGDEIARIEDTGLVLQVQEQAADLRRADARLKFLEGELERLQRLAETNLAAVSQIDQTLSERDVAAGDVAVGQSRLSQLEDQLLRTRITAPFAGRVVERLTQVGERVSVGMAVARLVNPDSLEVVARPPLNYYRYVRPGDELQVQAGPDQMLIAPVRTVVSVGGESQHVFELRLDVGGPLPVGLPVRVTVPTADVRDVLAVPRDALVLRGDGIAVFIVDPDNTARRIRVTTGIGEGEWIEVRGPIQEGDRVVVRGNERLRTGQRVQVQGAGSA